MDEKHCNNCSNSMTYAPNDGVTCPMVKDCKFKSHWVARQERKGMAEHDDGTIRKFDTGATRDTSEHKLDIEAFLSPQVLVRYNEYLDANRAQSDGTLRDGDNWQKGIPLKVYMKSLVRHFVDVWLIHRGHPEKAVVKDIETALCAILFNTMGYLFEVLNGKSISDNDAGS